MAPRKFAASLKSTKPRSAPRRSAPLNFAALIDTPTSLQSSNSAPQKSQPPRSASVKLRARTVWFLNENPLIIAETRLHSSNFTPKFRLFEKLAPSSLQPTNLVCASCVPSQLDPEKSHDLTELSTQLAYAKDSRCPLHRNHWQLSRLACSNEASRKSQSSKIALVRVMFFSIASEKLQPIKCRSLLEPEIKSPTLP